jgi:hypothetical protein
MDGGSGTLIASAGSTWVAPTTSPASGKASIAWDGVSAFRIYNNVANNKNISVAIIRCG